MLPPRIVIGDLVARVGSSRLMLVVDHDAAGHRVTCAWLADPPRDRPVLEQTFARTALVLVRRAPLA